MSEEIVLDPKALNEVLAKHSKDLPDSEIDILIAALREERKRLLAAEAAGKKKGKSPVNEALEAQRAKDLKFEDLDL